ncbi:DUF1513 domain-containing protein [Methylopila henanensis]|uniref:DUF1513 domain-containing protein n=1 Tax=Methylopila henanensis TaxID=873516 RepID=A0ABW4K322_9HYPH
MRLTRRAALGLIGAGLLGADAALGSELEFDAAAIGPGLDGAGAFRIGALDAALGLEAGALAPVRLHALAFRPDGAEAVAVGRRPGDLALVLDGAGHTLRSTFRASAGRRFSGHGAYRADGRSFVTSEIDAATGEGVLVLRDPADGYAARAEIASGGLGPHDVTEHRGLLVVANGAKEPKTDPGIATLGRTTARSNVALIDPATGRIEEVAEAASDLASLSLRHIVAAPNGGLLVAAQDTQAGVHDRPLVARFDRGRLRWLDVEADIAGRMNGSVCSLVVDRSGRFAAATCPRGGVVVGFDLARDAAVGLASAADVCGLAATRDAGGFVATTGLGEALRLVVSEDGVAVAARRTGALRWDNHLAPSRV